jgi:hypothetical protein
MAGAVSLGDRPQHGVAAAQDLVEGLGGGEEAGPAAEHRAVEEPPPVGRWSTHDRQILGREQHHVERAEVPGHRPHWLVVDQRGLALGLDHDAVAALELVPGDARAQLGPLRAVPDDLGEAVGAKRPQRGQHVHRLEEVRLALAVVAREDVEPRPRRQLERRQVAHAAKRERRDQHVVGETPSSSGLRCASA